MSINGLPFISQANAAKGAQRTAQTTKAGNVGNIQTTTPAEFQVGDQVKLSGKPASQAFNEAKMTFAEYRDAGTPVDGTTMTYGEKGDVSFVTYEA